MTPINFALPGFFKKTGSGAPEFNEDMPPITDDLSVFFDPEYGVFSDEGNTLAVDGDNIRQLWDRSATGNTLNQTTASAQPLYNTSVIGNGKASVQSNGDFFLTTNNIEIPNSQAGWTFYAVYKRSSGSDEYYVSTLSTNAYCRMEWRSVHMIRQLSGSGRFTSFTDDTDTKIVTYTLDRNAGTVGELKMYVNGTFYGNMSAGVSVANWPLEFNKLFNAAYGLNFGNQLWYNDAHSASQVLQVSEWLGDKYGLLVVPITENLSFYLDPDKEVYSDAGTTLATDGDNIRQWNDQSDNTITLSQASGSRQMTYHEGNLNGKNSVYRTGTAQRMDLSTASNISGSEDFTLYTVFNREDLNDMVHVARSYNGKVVDGSTTSSYYGGNNVSSDVTGLSSSTGTTVIRSYVMDRTNQNFLIYENGSLIGTNTDTSGSSGIYIDKIFNGGTPESGSAYYGNVLFYEGSAHDATETSTIHNWLNTKYGIYDPYAPPITDDLEVYFNPDFDVYSDAGTTLATDGDNIRQYNDRSGNDNTAEQTSASLQPLYDTSEFGNGNASLFTGSYDSLDFASAIVIPDTSSFTFHTVYKKDVLGDYNASIGNRGGEDSAHINHRSSYVRVSDDSNQYNWNSFSDDTTLKIISIVVDRSANTISVYKNGVLSVSNSITYSDTFTFRTLFAHSGIPGTNTYWGNILMYNGVAHDSTDVGTISDWLNDKYDIY